jgi:transcription antitermination factor NusB
MRKRSLARELALQILYQYDISGPEVVEEAEQLLSDRCSDPAVVRFATGLVSGWWENRVYIDELIQRSAHNWDLSRMAMIDRNILRLGTYELVFRPDIPAAVSINEAIDMAKKYSTQYSGQFVNGVLDNIRIQIQTPGNAPRASCTARP